MAEQNAAEGRRVAKPGNPITYLQKKQLLNHQPHSAWWSSGTYHRQKIYILKYTFYL